MLRGRLVVLDFSKNKLVCSFPDPVTAKKRANPRRTLALVLAVQIILVNDRKSSVVKSFHCVLNRACMLLAVILTPKAPAKAYLQF